MRELQSLEGRGLVAVSLVQGGLRVSRSLLGQSLRISDEAEQSGSPVRTVATRQVYSVLQRG